MNDAPPPPKSPENPASKHGDARAKAPAKREARIDSSKPGADAANKDGGSAGEKPRAGREKPIGSNDKAPGTAGSEKSTDKSQPKGWDVLKGHKREKGGSPGGLDRLRETLSSPESRQSKDLPPGSKLDRMKSIMDAANSPDASRAGVPRANREARLQSPDKTDRAATVAKDTRKEKDSVERGNTKPEPKRTREARITGDSSADKAEHNRVANPRDGIGFKHGSDVVDRKALKTFLDAQPKDSIQAVRDGRGWIEVTADASRDGSPKDNKDLTDRRAENLKSAIADELGIDAKKVQTYSRGESEAAKNGKPDRQDNADDRVGRIAFQELKDGTKPPDKPDEPGNVDAAYKTASDALPKTSPDRQAREQGDMLVKHVKKLAENTLKEGMKNPMMIKEIFVKELVKEGWKYGMDQVQWMGNKLADDLGSKDLKASIQADMVAGQQDALADFAGVRHIEHSALFRGEKSSLYRLARDSYRAELEKAPAAERRNLISVMRSGDRKALNDKLQRDFTQFSSRGIKR
jgi:hypothetical protein